MKTLLTLAMAAALLTACSQPNPEAEAALAEKKAHAARHALVDSMSNVYLNMVDPTKAGVMYAEGAMMYSPDYPNGKLATEALAEMVKQMGAFSEWKNTAKVQFSHHDGFAIAAGMTAKFSTDKAKDIPVSGPWVAVVKLNEAGKITEEHIMWDNASMMKQVEEGMKKKK